LSEQNSFSKFIQRCISPKNYPISDRASIDCLFDAHMPFYLFLWKPWFSIALFALKDVIPGTVGTLHFLGDVSCHTLRVTFHNHFQFFGAIIHRKKHGCKLRFRLEVAQAKLLISCWTKLFHPSNWSFDSDPDVKCCSISGRIKGRTFLSRIWVDWNWKTSLKITSLNFVGGNIHITIAFAFFFPSTHDCFCWWQDYKLIPSQKATKPLVTWILTISNA